MIRLLLAVDGSAHADRAIEIVAKLARAGMPVEVVLVNVRDLPVIYSEAPLLDADLLEQALKASQEQLLSDAQARALGCGLEVVAALRAVGAPAEEIVRLAREQAVDQIVMGSHGRGAIGSLFLGSVAQRVVHLCDVPVLLVK